MKQYKRIQGAENIRQLRLMANDSAIEVGSSRFKGETFDIVVPD